MHSAPVVVVKETASRRSACGSGLFFGRVENWVTAILAGLMPACYGVALLVSTGLALWHAHLTVLVINFGSSFGVRDGLLVLSILGEALLSVLLVRQLHTPHVPSTVRMELLPGDQPELFKVIRMVADKVRAPMPSIVVVDSSAGISADFASSMGALRGRGLRLNLGLCLPVGTNVPELVGLLAHELAFFSRGTGVASARFIRGVHRWFLLRIKHDPWLDWLLECSDTSRKLQRWGCLLLWGCVWLSLRPLRLLYGLCRLMTAGSLAEMVRRADACAARLVGSEVMEQALQQHALLTCLCGQVHEGLRGDSVSVRLPDNIPLLVSRRLMIDQVTPEELPVSSHWLDMAPPDAKRLLQVGKMKVESMIESEGDATGLFRNFHELARRATYFHYQNTWGLAINEHRLVAVEETVHDSRASMQTVITLNYYFHGLAHPERAFCGIAEEHSAPRDPDAILMELRDCREWLDQYGERMAAALTEWTKTWRLVRDLQTACVLTQAGLSVNALQFCVRTNSAEAFMEEIEHQRHIMDNMEGVLRQYEGRLETRIACSLELLWRADARTMAPALLEVRRTLPHWVLIYEALGLNLPVLRELMTHFHAFQSLGATVSGMVSSASYVNTVQASMPMILRLVSDILSTIGKWPYPFKTDIGPEGLSLAGFIAPQVHELNLGELLDPRCMARPEGEGTVLAQVSAKRLCELVAPLIDRYLSLYHQAFAWVSKASDMAEVLLFNPFEEERLRQSIALARARDAGIVMAPQMLSSTDPELARSTRSPALAA